MKAQKIKLNDNTQPFWIVVGDDYLPIKSIYQYLFFLRSIDKSPNTIRTYAHHLKIFWEYLAINQLEWNKINIEKLARFVATLNGLIDGKITNLSIPKGKRSARTINQIIVAVAGFYQYHHRLGQAPNMPLYDWKRPFITGKSFKPFLHHINKSKKQRKSFIKLREEKKLAQVVEPEIIKQMIANCKRIRDKFLICLLYETGCRIGQALGLHHEDIETFNNIIMIRPRDNNFNNARAKTRQMNKINVSKNLMNLYYEYYMKEYGDIKSDYVFINLWQGKIGNPMTYNAVITLFNRLSKKVGVHVTPHMLRHTHATELIKAKWGMAHVQKRLGHQNIQTTINTYTHITNDDLKEQFQDYLQSRGDDLCQN
ncbi:MAG: tyrosine-type recombinase/integrase [Gammaproteobacteria bacterium]|jgi:integrase